MGMFINTNVAAINAQRNLNVTGGKMSKALEQLSSGLRINRAADDAEASCQIDSNNDVWFVYTATCDGAVFMSTTGSQFAPSNDPVLSVYDACPGTGGVEIACDDDSGIDL